MTVPSYQHSCEPEKGYVLGLNFYREKQEREALFKRTHLIISQRKGLLSEMAFDLQMTSTGNRNATGGEVGQIMEEQQSRKLTTTPEKPMAERRRRPEDCRFDA